MPFRKERIKELLHHEIAQVLEEDFRTPGIFITIMDVRISDDGQHAAVSYSVLPESKETDTVEMLDRAIYAIQQRVNKRLRIRPVPKIRFVIDRSGAKAARIDEILRTIDNKQPPYDGSKSSRANRSKPGNVRKTARPRA